jgi:penicillin-binding protein 1B
MRRTKTFQNTRHQADYATVGAARRRNPPPRARRRPRRRAFRFRWYWLLLIIIMFFCGGYVSELDVQVRAKFEGQRWALPARVYASPLELYTGLRLTPSILSKELKELGYQNTSSPKKAGEYWHNNNEFLIITRAFQFWDASDLSRTVQIRFMDNQISSVRDLSPNGKRASPLIRLEPKLIGKIYPAHNEDRILVRSGEVPKHLTDALIVMEDRNFYNHWGISIIGTLRAFVANFRAGKLVQGGSTLTQQLVKNFYLSSERTLKRKINEAIMALLLEWHYNKNEILETYLNEVYLGQSGKRAVHGIGLAARFYFNRPLEELDLSQLALLVSLVRGASVYNPRKHPKRVLARRNLVLDVMVKQGKITQIEAQQAKAMPLGITKEKSESVFPYPAFMALVRRQLHRYYDEEDLRSEGLQIFTTLNPRLQNAAEEAMVNALKKKLEKKRPKAINLEGAMIVTNSSQGEILAMVNGKNTRYSGFNRPLDAERQIGSLMKPAIFLSALEQHQTYDLITPIDDSPYQLKSKSGIWKPKNYDRRYHGYVPLYKVLAKSYNVATVRLGMELGLRKITNTLRRLGIKRKFNKLYPSMLLGSMTLTPLEVTQMYQTIASGGFRVPLRAIRNVLDRNGKPLQHYSLSIEQRFDAGPIFLLNYALQKVLKEGTGRSVAKKLPKEMVLAGKTGTTNNSRDSWFVGYGSELLTVTWVGRDDNKPMGLTGASGAMIIWRDFIKSVHPNATAPITPSSVEWRSIEGKDIPFIIDEQVMMENSSLFFAGNN